MIDLKIKSLFSEIKTEEQALELLNSPVRIYEKIDGTKLTLFRNNIEYDPSDYTKNWVVSYKSNIISKEEFSFFVNDDLLLSQVKDNSIGISQYYFVHKFLEEKIHPNAKELPINTELFVEFVQRKPTLTRDYEKYHALFLIGYCFGVKSYIDFNRYYSIGEIIFDQILVNELAKNLMINSPPAIFSGIFSKLNTLQKTTYLHRLLDVMNRFLYLDSILGGKIEGVVIYSEKTKKLYKHVQIDQYNKNTRLQKKLRYKANSEENENKYWNAIISSSKKIYEKIKNRPSNISDKISFASKLIYKLNSSFDNFLELNPNKFPINIKDDLYLTTKLILQSHIINVTNQLGLYVIAGKPIHLGHWKVIEKASKENEKVVLFISTSNRENISGKDMFDIWVDYIIPILPKNVHCIFSDGPMQELMHLINFSNTHKNLLYSLLVIYSDDFDSLQLKQNDKINFDFVKFCGINRLQTVDISGTLMRQFLNSDIKISFKKYLPPVGDENKEKIWEKLKNK